MPCFGPLVGYFSKELNPDTGKRSIVFDPRKALSGVPITIPCGECIGCRMSWRLQWAIRCMHEKRLHRESAFVTLTYDDEHLPELGSLVMKDLQLFMKRLRFARFPGIRFFACGEYGEVRQRPHYHLLLFNTCFPDQRRLRRNHQGDWLYTSKELEKLWPMGHNWIGNVTEASCAYVVGYMTKKVGAPIDYGDREPEFRVMSRRPGIGSGWLDKYEAEAYRHDSAIMDGKEVPLPRYYDTKQDAKWMEELKRQRNRSALEPTRMEKLKAERKRKMLALNPEDRTKERMMVREEFALRMQQRFKREV